MRNDNNFRDILQLLLSLMRTANENEFRILTKEKKMTMIQFLKTSWSLSKNSLLSHGASSSQVVVVSGSRRERDTGFGWEGVDAIQGWEEWMEDHPRSIKE